ncbi:MAG: heat-inducible transcription repressor HrcA [Eggerthellaceae bacterium]|nr:heat-inducible transcription repressor HrcA [Eggerthellaceae bacterium]
MLSSRRQRILCALIEEYVANACPVGSRTIAENHKLGVSPATIRNELSALEDEGYITQPHTSAGRIPTDAGYREFVDEILTDEGVAAHMPQTSAIEELRRSADALDDLIERTNSELARLTECLSVIMSPVSAASRIRQVSLISLTDLSALVVLVTDDGQVANENVIFASALSATDLSALEGQLNHALVGRAADEVSTLAASADPAFRTEHAQVVLHALSCAAATLTRARSTRSGMSTLLRKPEFHDSESLLPVMEILEDDTVLFKALGPDGEDADGIRIRIGHENASEQLFGVSVVAGAYGRGPYQGMIAVIGPTRMDYSKTIGAVQAARRMLNGE